MLLTGHCGCPFFNPTCIVHCLVSSKLDERLVLAIHFCCLLIHLIFLSSFCVVLAARHLWLFSSAPSNHEGSWDTLLSHSKAQLELYQQVPCKYRSCGCTAHVHVFLHDVTCTQHNSFVWEGLDGSRYEWPHHMNVHVVLAIPLRVLICPRELPSVNKP